VTYLLCLQLMKALGKSQFQSVALATAISLRLAVEQTSGYLHKDDVYYYNQTTATMYLINANGVQSSVGTAT
jgi:hypothetical protein